MAIKTTIIIFNKHNILLKEVRLDLARALARLNGDAPVETFRLEIIMPDYKPSHPGNFKKGD